jgi:hypothetical protein
MGCATKRAVTIGILRTSLAIVAISVASYTTLKFPTFRDDPADRHVVLLAHASFSVSHRTHVEARETLALLWQNLATDWGNWIPESGFQ